MPERSPNNASTVRKALTADATINDLSEAHARKMQRGGLAMSANAS
jgi:hypothetical protein